MNVAHFYQLTLIGLVIIFGCSTSEKIEHNSPQEHLISLSVSNCFDTEPIHIFVKIMDTGRKQLKETRFEKIIVDQDFNSKSRDLPFFCYLNLNEGTYVLYLESKTDNYKMRVIFDVDKPLWLDLTYSGKNHFGLNISKYPFVRG